MSKLHADNQSVEFSVLPGGFAMAVVVWITAFIGRFPGVPLSGKSMLFLLLAVLFLGALLLAFFGPSDSSPSAKVKRIAFSLSVTGLINILLVGSVVGASSLGLSSSPAAVDRVTLSALLWIPGSFIATVILGIMAAFLANIFIRNKISATTSKTSPATSRQAALAAIILFTTLCLIFVGAVVTSAGAGLSVPDWPTSYGWNMFLFPFTKMVGGIYYEHAHRLIGSLVGLETLILFIWLWRTPPIKNNTSLPTTNTPPQNNTQLSTTSTLNHRYSWWGTIALLFVCLQGALGGIRVFENDTRIAVIHALTAQIFLAIIAGLLWHLVHHYSSLQSSIPHPHYEAAVHKPRTLRTLRTLPIILIMLILLQTLAGAIYRHYRIQPAFHFHLLGAGLILIIVVILLAKIMMGNIIRPPNAGPIVRTVFIIFIITVCQIALGMATWMLTARYDRIDQTTSDPIIFTTAGHVVGGSVLLAAAVWLSLQTLHFFPQPLAASENQPNNTPAEK